MIPSETPGTSVMPIFPLGNVAYVPGSTQVLNIFEPRYREMYSAILMSGGRRFVTTMVSEDSQLAEVGVVLYLEELKEVSQQTNDQVKYVCTHKVLENRVKILSILNPSVAASQDTYMRCEVSEIVDSDAPPPTLPTPKTDAYDDDDDDDDDADAAPSPAPAPPVLQKREPGVLKAELAVLAALETVAAMQEEGQEDVRFSQEAVKKLGARSGTGTGSLWGVVELWKNFLDARAQAASRKVQAEVQARLVKYLTEKTGKSEKQLPNQVILSDLPPDLQRDVKNLRKRVMAEIAPLIAEQTRGTQMLLQATSHVERLELFKNMIEAEQKRLVARRTLKATLVALGVDDDADDFP